MESKLPFGKSRAIFDAIKELFLLIEIFRRKPVPQKVEAYIHLSGYVLLFGLMIVLTCKDIFQIFH